MPADFVVATKSGRLFEIGSNLSVLEPTKPYIAIGSGAEIASGAVQALMSNGKCDAAFVVEQGLRAAASLMDSVGPPYHIMNTRDDL